MATNDKKDKMLVAAIDFGTTYSGYAFSFKHDYQTDPSKVSTNQNWVAGSMSLVSLKAPTVALFDENQKFHSFGYEAENNYSELALDEEHEKYYFFKRFKMRLHGKKIQRDIEIDDDRGRKMTAMLVFSEIIRYLKDHLLKLLEMRGTGVDNKDIHWVLTVPAIWSDSAKQFMRETATKAGIEGGQLSIALEPEAASLYCQLIPTNKIHGSEGAKFAVASPGTKYMVIDLGGGTADITVHQRQADGGLKELHKASGGAWGGTKVDEEFYQLLIRLIGAPVWSKFCEEHTADFLDLQRELETKKRTIKPESSGKITIKVPVTIVQTYEKESEESIDDAISGSNYNGKIKWMGDKMRIEAPVFKNLFKSCSDKIVNHIKDLLAMPDVQGTNIFLMVGGFSESAMLQNAIITSLPKSKVIIPDEPGLCVLKGAVIFGHRPIAITSRVSKYTYGINISPPFDPAIHKEDHRVSVGGIDRCRDIFKRYIQEGETVRVGEARSGKHVTLKSSQKEMLLKIFASPKREPMYVDEEDCETLGKVVVNLPDSEEKIRVEVKMMFGETELTVEAQELSTHTKYRAYFDFM
ncbi:heat shock 70 kDa protein 12B-like [Mya arenaria]|uniref:heat shock 70 kDa protein 12B-like n=1 Tax=Mya arenaria TaxID=6604 RepID=UPI0022E9241F|nr:heat shock 70 kDa protein 12B-like [Mya arenaria]XP_052793110.1 heat shock 70 kDa protein 12B-like [Mya arenaria]